MISVIISVIRATDSHEQTNGFHKSKHAHHSGLRGITTNIAIHPSKYRKMRIIFLKLDGSTQKTLEIHVDLVGKNNLDML